MDFFEDVSVQFRELDVASSETTLSSDSFGNGVERKQLNFIERGRHFLLDLPERDELLVVDVDVLLVDFICKDGQLMLGRKPRIMHTCCDILNEVLDGLPVQDLTRGISWVDGHDDLGLDSLCDGILVLLLKLVH